MVTIDPKLAQQAVLTLKFLAVDAVERAKSGHPGMPMGAADVAFVIWGRFLRYDPSTPDWPDRDRFVLSAGHGCMLLYGLLHLAGYELPISELQQFRQWGSRTPGHPEFGLTAGVEATTGPLGQGVSNAVGMALAAKMLAARFNQAGEFKPVTHRVFVLASDGDLMEGVSAEAGSLAGHLGLGNLLVCYDDNHVTIEGDTKLAFSEDVGRRYEAYGWHVQHVDGHDHEAIARAASAALAEEARPSLIVCRTHIAHGAPTKQDSAESHGAPLGAEEVRRTKELAGWPLEPTFLVPDEVRAFFKARAEEGAALRIAWESRLEEWQREHTELAESWDAICRRRVPADIVDRLLAGAPSSAAATRSHSSAVIQQAAALVPAMAGGSADLAPSTNTLIQGAPSIARGEFAGRNLHFGVREHAMGAIVNGFGYHGTFRAYGATFLIFSDYMRPAIRLAALSHLPSIFVFTHDSVFLGEDGPTHEPIEHLWALRAIPHLRLFRPADGLETALAWGQALARADGPSAIVLTRQKLPAIRREATGELADPRRGGYLVAGDDRPQAIVAATGSELQLAVGARERLAQGGKRLNVVSIPCYEILVEQDSAYRERLFPAGVPIATIEAGRSDPWRQLSGPTGLNIGIDRFGASAPAEVIAEKLGFTVDAVTARLREWLG
ncbi:MAG TPA: transketolase [Candidatus Polarisedimenticolaceae bacterium]|nr:transketolase [Candidatus Polarisedimenticolaceae bacterium]